MSTQFWVKLFLALSLLPLTFFTVHSYRKGVLRELRAKWLRRKIVSAMEALLPQLQSLLREEQGDDFLLFRLRAQLEQLYTQSDVLLTEEKAHLNDFLASLSSFYSMSEAGTASSVNLNNVVLLGQRVIHESTELGY